MRVYITLAVTVLFSSGCKPFKPSSDLNDFSSYFIEDNKSEPSLGQIKVTFFVTSTLLFDDGETQLLTDGFFSRPSIGKLFFCKISSDTDTIKRVINGHHINRLKAIFVCHSHYDHVMDAPVVSKLTGAKVYGSTSTLNVCKGEELADTCMKLFEPEKEISIGDFLVTVIKSRHTPPFKLFGKTNATDPNHPDITEPLKQPVNAEEYIEGGTYDVYIKHGEHKILVKASTNYIEGALNEYPTDVFFLGSAMLGIQSSEFQNNYYQNTIGATGAKILIPVHWDNFTKPLSKPLEALLNISDNVDSAFLFLFEKTKKDRVDFKLMQGGTSLMLF